MHDIQFCKMIPNMHENIYIERCIKIFKICFPNIIIIFCLQHIILQTSDQGYAAETIPKIQNNIYLCIKEVPHKEWI